jgi:hypothetical protein
MPRCVPHREPSLSEFLNAGRDSIRRQLNRLAFEAHRDQLGIQGTADISQRALIDALFKANPNPHAGIDRVEKLNSDLARTWDTSRSNVSAMAIVC